MKGVSKPRLTEAQRAAIVADYLSGLSANEVGRRHKVKHTTVRRAVMAAGHAIRPGSAYVAVVWTEARNAELARLWAEGRTRRQIAEAIGVTEGAVEAQIRTLRSRGVELASRRRVGQSVRLKDDEWSMVYDAEREAEVMSRVSFAGQNVRENPAMLWRPERDPTWAPGAGCSLKPARAAMRGRAA